MNSEEAYAKAMQMMELAKGTMNPSRRRTLMDDAFALIKQAKELRAKEPAKNGAGPRYRVRFNRENGFIYFDLPVTSLVDALWAAEALAAALSDEYESYALWDRQTQVLHGLTSHAVLAEHTAIKVSEACQRIVLDAEELAAANHEILSRSRRLLEARATMHRIVTETGDNSARLEASQHPNRAS